MKRIIPILFLLFPLLATSQVNQYTALRIAATDSLLLRDTWIRKITTNLNSSDSNSHNMLPTNRAVMDAIRAFGGGGSITPPGSNQQVIFNDAGSFGAAQAVTYNKLLRLLQVDSIMGIKVRFDSFAFNPQQVITNFTEDSIVSVGNSITFYLNANPVDSGYIYQLGDFLGMFNSNLAVSGRGCITAIAAYHSRINPGHNALGSIMVGFNDLRNTDLLGVNGFKLRNKIVNTFKSFWANHLLKTVVNPTNGTGVTRNGSWSVNWNASNAGGKSVNLGAYTNTTGDYIEYTFTDTTLVLGFIGGDGSAASHIGATVDITIDAVPIETVSLNNATDGVTDGNGALDPQHQPVVRIYTGLTNTAHTVRITKTAATGYLLMDYFGHLVDRDSARHQLWFHVPHMKALGYALAPAQSSYAKTDTINTVIDSLFNALAQGYGAIRVQTNSVYDTTTGTDDDGIHPNNEGHYQIFRAATNAFLTSLLGNQIITDGQYWYGYYGGLPHQFAYDAELRNYINNIADNNGNGLVGGSGTINTLPKWSASKVLTDSRITDNGTTISANGNTQVNGSITTSTSSAGINWNRRDNNTFAFGIYSTAGDEQHFLGGADRMRLTAAGLLGIGTSSPGRLLHPEIVDATTNTIVYPFRMSHQTTGTNATGSGVGFEFVNENGGGVNPVTGSIANVYTNATNGSENADLNINLIGTGALKEVVNIKPAGALQIQTDSDPNGAVFDLYRNDITPTAGDRLGEFHFYGRNASSTKTQYAALYAESPGITAGAESGRLLANITVGGVITESFRTEASGSSTVTTLSSAARLDGGNKSVSFGNISGVPNYFKYEHSVNGQMNLGFVNTNTGASAYVDVQVTGDNSFNAVNALRLLKFSPNWVTTGPYKQSGATLESGSSLSGGLTLLSSHASGQINFYAGGIAAGNERLRITPTDIHLRGIPTGNTSMNILLHHTDSNVYQIPLTNLLPIGQANQVLTGNRTVSGSEVYDLRFTGIDTTEITAFQTVINGRFSMENELNESIIESSGAVTFSTSVNYVFTGTTETWTLPALASNQKRIYHVKNAGSGNLTIDTAGGNIYDNASQTSIVIPAGGYRTFKAGPSFWYVFTN